IAHQRNCATWSDSAHFVKARAVVRAISRPTQPIQLGGNIAPTTKLWSHWVKGLGLNSWRGFGRSRAPLRPARLACYASVAAAFAAYVDGSNLNRGAAARDVQRASLAQCHLDLMKQRVAKERLLDQNHPGSGSACSHRGSRMRGDED